jgi:hypothetical protein
MQHTRNPRRISPEAHTLYVERRHADRERTMTRNSDRKVKWGTR